MPSISTKIESKNKSTRTATLWGFNASHSKSISIYIVLTLWSWATFNSSGKAFYKIYRMSEGNVWPSIQKCICEVRHCGRMSRGGLWLAIFLLFHPNRCLMGPRQERRVSLSKSSTPNCPKHDFMGIALHAEAQSYQHRNSLSPNCFYKFRSKEFSTMTWVMS